MVHKHREILNNRNAIFSLCEGSYEAQFKPDVTSFFVGWCIYENFRSLLPRPWLNPTSVRWKSESYTINTTMISMKKTKEEPKRR